MSRKTYFVTCPLCGSNNDPGEVCTCQERRKDNAKETFRIRNDTKSATTKAHAYRVNSGSIGSYRLKCCMDNF